MLMLRHAVFLNRYSGHPHPNKLKIIEAMPPDWLVFAVTANSKLSTEIKRGNLKIIKLLDAPAFSREINDEDILKQEKWLGVPFTTVLNYCYEWDPKNEENVEKLKQYHEFIARLVIFWKDFFKNNKIDVYTDSLESSYADTVAYLVAEKLKIKCIHVSAGRVSNTFMLYGNRFEPLYWKRLSKDEIKKSAAKIRERYKKKEKIEYTNIQGYVDKSTRIRGFLNRTSMSRFLAYSLDYYRQNKYARLIMTHPLKMIKRKAVWFFRRKLSSLVLKQEKAHKTGERYLLFPLHFTKEAMISYLETFTDQFELIHKITKMLPGDVILYVKPHPHWLFADTPLSEILKIGKNPKIKIISAEANTYELIRHSLGVLTINSTVGLEAMAMGKPVVTFGHDFYCQDGIATVVRDLTEMPHIIMLMANNALTHNKDKIDKFLALYFEHLMPVELDIGVGDNLITDKDAKTISGNIAKLAKNM